MIPILRRRARAASGEWSIAALDAAIAARSASAPSRVVRSYDGGTAFLRVPARSAVRFAIPR